MAGTSGMNMNEGSEPKPMNSAVSFVLSGMLSQASHDTSRGTPAETARPPTLAMNMRTEVRMVISLVSRVSDELSAP